MEPDAKRFYPVFLDLTGRLAVVVGGGKAALRRARQLTNYGADATVISADPGEDLLAAEAEGLVIVEHRGYVRGDLTGASIAICVEADEELQRAVRAEAESAGCLVNVTGAPELCSFILPSVVNREPLQIAISTGGAAPGIAKQVRREIAEKYGPEWADYTRLMGEFRELVHSKIESEKSREAVLTAAADSDLLERLKTGGPRPSAAALYAQFAHNAQVKGDTA